MIWRSAQRAASAPGTSPTAKVGLDKPLSRIMNTIMKPQYSPDRRALSTISNNSNIPVSPTANLKLLTKVASELMSPVLNVKVPNRNAHPKDNDSKTRKEKSLGILCDRFLAMFPLNLPPGCEVLEICLDRVAQQLGIVKRRIYDIINILESLQMASKIAKNRYHWHGCQNLQATLCQLKGMALELGIDQKLKDIQVQQKNGFRLVSGPTCCCVKDPLSQVDSSNVSYSAVEGDPSQRSENGFLSDERTLGVMCLKFIMLFLASPQSGARINLDLATRMLVSEAAEGNLERQQWGMKVECHRAEGEKTCEAGSKSCRCMLRLKTKVRRLYDIANVLTSLGLITKIESATNSMRKPIFTYTGPYVELASAQGSHPCISMKRFFSSAPFEDDEGVENKTKSTSQKRKDVKPKGGPPMKLLRISSDNNLDKASGRCAASHNLSARHVSHISPVHPESSQSLYRCSLDDILHVAGQELEKIRTSEELAAAQKLSGARKKLSFSRSHSDSCIQPPAVQELDQNAYPQNVVVTEEASNFTPKKRVCITLTDPKSKRFTITRKLVEVPSHALPPRLSEDRSLKVRTITPLQAQTLSALFGISHQQVQPVGLKSDSNHLSAAANADVENNNKPAVQPMQSLMVKSLDRQSTNVSNCSVAPSSIAPGELYRAVKVGNVVRLVPLITTRMGAKSTDCKKKI